MSEKVLSLSIAAYNMEKYLQETLDSCLIDEDLDKLEVMIVNDGSKDKTAEIASQYSEKYPDVFKLINKENGGYGSTVETGITNATGKYFKLLDGDDKMDQDGLKKLIAILENETSDIVITKNSEFDDETGEEWSIGNSWSEYIDKSLKICEMKKTTHISMWNLTAKTSNLQNKIYKFPKKILYTDCLFVMEAMAKSNTISFYDLNVYKYRTAREGQSTSPEVMKRHFNDKLQVLSLLNERLDLERQSKNANVEQLKNLVAEMYCLAVVTGYLIKPREKFAKAELKAFEAKWKKESREVYEEAAILSKKIKLLRLTNYLTFKFV